MLAFAAAAAAGAACIWACCCCIICIISAICCCDCCVLLTSSSIFIFLHSNSVSLSSLSVWLLSLKNETVSLPLLSLLAQSIIPLLSLTPSLFFSRLLLLCYFLSEPISSDIPLLHSSLLCFFWYFSSIRANFSFTGFWNTLNWRSRVLFKVSTIVDQTCPLYTPPLHFTSPWFVQQE